MPDLKSETRLPKQSIKKLNSDIVEVNVSLTATSPEESKTLNGIDKQTHSKISEATCPEDEEKSVSSSPKTKKEEAKEDEN